MSYDFQKQLLDLRLGNVCCLSLFTSIREKDAKASSSAKMFKSLHELVEHYQFCLKIPYTSSITKESWFFGDLSSEETNELLSGQEVGTFCVRFSSSGTLAISFVDGEV